MVDLAMHDVEEIKLGHIRELGTGFSNVRTLTIKNKEGEELKISIFSREGSDKLTIKQET